MKNVHVFAIAARTPPLGVIPVKFVGSKEEDLVLTPEFKAQFGTDPDIDERKLIKVFLQLNPVYQAAMAWVYGLGYPSRDWNETFHGTVCPNDDPIQGIEGLALLGVLEIRYRLEILTKRKPASKRTKKRKKQHPDVESEIQNCLLPEDESKEAHGRETAVSQRKFYVNAQVRETAKRLIRSKVFRDKIGRVITRTELEQKIAAIFERDRDIFNAVRLRFGPKGKVRAYAQIASKLESSEASAYNWVRKGLQFIRDGH